MAIPRLGLVVEDKPTELSCVRATGYSRLKRYEVLSLQIPNYMKTTQQTLMYDCIVNNKHNVVQVSSHVEVVAVALYLHGNHTS